MGTTKQDQERVRALLKEAITVLCKNGLQYRAKFSIEGLLGITLDDDEVFLVSIHEQVGEEVSKILQQKELPPPASPLSRTAGSSGGSQPSHSAPASPRTPGSKKTQSKKSTVLPVTVNLDQEESDNSRDSMGQSVLDSTPSGHSQPLPGSMASPSRQSSSNMEHNQRKRPRDSTASPNGDDQHQNFGSLQLSVDDIPGEGAARSGDDADTGTRLQSEDSEHSAKRRALDSSHTQSSADSDILSNIEVKQEIEEDEEDLIFVKEEGNQNPPSCQLAMSQSSSSEMMLGGVPQFSDSDQPGPSHWDPLQGPPQNLHGAQLGSSPAQDSQVSGHNMWRSILPSHAHLRGGPLYMASPYKQQSASSTFVPWRSVSRDVFPMLPPGGSAVQSDAPGEKSKSLKKRDKWALRTFSHWVTCHNNKPGVTKKVDKPLEKMNDSELNEWMSLFIQEARKADGSVFFSNSLQALVSAIQSYLRSEHNSTVDFKGASKFAPIRQALDAQLRWIQEERIEIPSFSRDICGQGEDLKLWSIGLLGTSTPRMLLGTMIYLNTKYFKIRLAEQHAALRFTNSQITLHEPQDKMPFIKYTEDTSETGQGQERARTVIHSYANMEAPHRCHVQLYKLYLSKCPADDRHDAFYLTPVLTPTDASWYYAHSPMNKQDIKQLMDDMCREATLKGLSSPTLHQIDSSEDIQDTISN